MLVFLVENKFGIEKYYYFLGYIYFSVLGNFFGLRRDIILRLEEISGIRL